VFLERGDLLGEERSPLSKPLTPQELSPRDGMQTSVRGEIFFFGVRWRKSAFFQRKSTIVGGDVLDAPKNAGIFAI
jgi:hypothetical protein